MGSQGHFGRLQGIPVILMDGVSGVEGKSRRSHSASGRLKGFPKGLKDISCVLENFRGVSKGPLVVLKEGFR